LDGRKRAHLPPELVALAGGGDPAQAPPELVAVLGDGRFRLPGPGPASWMAQSGDGKVLAVPCGNLVVLFDARTGVLLRTLAGHRNRVYRVAFSPDGKRLVSGACSGDDHSVKLWEVATGQVILTLAGSRGGVWGVAFSPDGKWVVSCGVDRT